MRWFGWFRSDPKKEIRKAAEAYKVMQSRSIGVYKDLGADNGRSTNFFDAYGGVIEEYINQYRNEEEDDENIKNLKNAYLLLHPEKAAQNQPQAAQEGTQTSGSEPGSGARATQPSGTGEAASSQNTQSTPSSQSSPAPQSAPASASESSRAASTQKTRSVEDTMMEHYAKTELHHELGDQEREELSKGIDPAAMQGMQAISQWMLRNCVKSGLFRTSKSADEKIAFIHSFALKQPARIKLYAYYMIEKGKRKEDDPEKISANIATSQLDYVPNLEAFKSKMIATKFKFWKRFTSDAIYWNKLDEAFNAARDSKDQIKPFGDMGVMDISGGSPASGTQSPAADNAAQQNSSAASSNASAAQNPAATTQTVSAPASGEAAAATEQTGSGASSDPLAAKSEERNNKYKDFMNKGREIIRLKNEMRTADEKGKKTKEEEIRKAVGNLITALNELKAIDKAIEEAKRAAAGGSENSAVTNAEEDSRLNMDVSNAAKERTVSKGSFYGGFAGTLVGAGGGGFKATGDNDYFSWGLDKNVEDQLEKLKDIQQAGDIISVVGASISVISIVAHAYDVYKNGAQMTAGAKIMAGADILTSALSTAKTMTTAIQGLAGASKDAITQVGGAVGIAAGSMGVITGGIDYFNAKRQKHKSDQLENELYMRTGRERDENSPELRDTIKAKNTARLNRRLADVRENLAMAKMATGMVDIVGGALAVSGVAAGFGVLFSGISVGIKLGVYLYKLAKKKGIMYDTIDDFIDMSSIYNDVVGSDNVDDKQREQIQRQIRIQAAAKLGFSSRENLFNAITAQYAKNIFMHVFFKKGSKTVKALKEDDSDPDYIKLLDALKLKPDYTSRKPSVNTIAYQLQNL